MYKRFEQNDVKLVKQFRIEIIYTLYSLHGLNIGKTKWKIMV